MYSTLRLTAIFCGWLFAGMLPLLAGNPHYRFIENKGQWQPETVKYRADLPGGKLYVENTALTFHFYRYNKHNHSHSETDEREEGNHHNYHAETQGNEPAYKGHSYRMAFEGANTDAIIKHSLPFVTNYSYFYGKNPDKWVGGAKAYNRLLIKDLYPSIDLKIKENTRGLKYEYMAQAGANLEQIQVSYQGQDSISMTKDGNLLILTSMAEVQELRPVAWQLTADGQEIPLACYFRLENNVVSYVFPDGYNADLETVIDPQLVFSSYSGSFADNWGNTATYDALGNGYAGGSVFSTGFPATLGQQIGFDTAYVFPNQPSNAFFTDTDIGIMKFSSDSADLLYATYLGDTLTEVPHSMVVDKDGNLVVFGTTGSAFFPVTTNAFDTTFNGGTSIAPIGGIAFDNGTDMFVAKISEDGTQLLASTFVGGAGNDGVQPPASPANVLVKNYGDELRGEVIADSSGNVYVASYTTSLDFPVQNAFQNTYGGGLIDAVAFKISSNLDSLVWSTYIGGFNRDVAYGIQLDTLNQAYITGGTVSANFPVDPAGGGLNPIWQGNVDGFLMHLSADGSQLLHSTFLGTASYNQSYLVQLDQDQNVYVIGQTNNGYPIVSARDSVYADTNMGQFIHKLTPALDSTIFSTTFGSRLNLPQLSPTAFLVDDCDRIYVSGWGGQTNSTISGYIGGNTNNLATQVSDPDDYINAFTDGSDFYLAVFAPNAEYLEYATFFGENTAGGFTGDHVDGGTCRFDKRGFVYHAVCASCGNTNGLPTTPGAWSENNLSNNCNMALFKMSLSPKRLQVVVIPDADGCAPFSTILTTTDTLLNTVYNWNGGNGIIDSNSVNPALPVTYDQPGTYFVSVEVVSTSECVDNVTAYDTVTVFNPPSYRDTLLRVCVGDSIELALNKDPNDFFSWSPTAFLSNDSIFNPKATPLQDIIYTVIAEDNNGCLDTHNVSLAVSEPRNLINDTSFAACDGDVVAVNIQGDTSYDINWFPIIQVQNPSQAATQVTVDSSVNYTIVVSDSVGCKDTVQVNITAELTDDFVDEIILKCPDDTALLQATITNPNYIYSWQDTTLSSPNRNVYPQNNTLYTLFIGTMSGCLKSQNFTLNVSTPPQIADTIIDFCVADTVLLDVNNPTGYSYRWRPLNNPFSVIDDSTAISPMVYTDSGGIHFTVVILDSIGCFTTRQVVLQPVLPPILGDTSLVICEGESQQLGDGYPLNLNYQWFPALQLSNDTVARPTVQASNDMVYTVNVSDDLGCNRDFTVAVTASRPRLPADHLAYFCLNETLTLGNDGIGHSTDYDYAWQPNIWLSDSTAALPVASPQNDITYTVMATDSAGCQLSRSVRLRLGVPDFSGSQQLFCKGVPLTLRPPIASPNYVYNWTGNNVSVPFTNLDGSVTLPQQPQSSGTITLSIIDLPSGCRLSRDFTVVPTPDTARISSVFAYKDCGSYPQYRFISNFDSTFAINWFIDTLAFTDDKVDFLTYEEGVMNVRLRATDSSGCVQQQSVILPVIKYDAPNVVTPNNDGLNDNFEIRGLFEQQSLRLEVYNRWGKEVYSKDDYDNSWSPVELSAGTYFYYLKPENMPACRSWLQVLR